MRLRIQPGIICAALVAAMIAAAASSASAQTHGTVAGGYAFLHEFESSPGIGGVAYPAGWVADIGVQPGTSQLSFVGEVSGNYRKPAGVYLTLHGFLGGARFSSRPMGGLVPYGQVLLGVERYGEPGFSENGFAFQPGGGVGYSISPRVSARGQIDFRFVNEQSQTFKELRFAALVAFGVW
jgi:hypothetical protein